MTVDGQLEKSILGAALTADTSAQLVAAKLTPDDFYIPRHSEILRAIQNAVIRDEPTDTVSIASKVDEVHSGGPMYLFELVQAAALPASLEHHIQTLRTESARRRLTAAGERIAMLSKTPDFDQALSQSHELLDSVVGADVSEAQRIDTVVDETLDRFEQIQKGTAPKGLMTGFYDLDRITNGFQPGQMVIIAARPGVGKSTLAVDIMRNLSIRERVPTAIFALEMSTHEINTRVLASESRVEINAMRDGSMKDQDWDKVVEVRGKLDDAPLFIDDSPENTVMEIVAKTKMLVKRHGVKLIVVDYLQLLKSGQREESRQQEVAGFSRALKLLAKSAGIPVIAVAQLNRTSARDGQPPKPSDLRESGALEQDADIILLLDRDDLKSKDTGGAGEVDVIVSKNRGGETGKITLANRLYYGCFDNFRGA